jgi:hypothetical protein
VREGGPYTSKCWKDNGEELSSLPEVGLNDQVTTKLDKFGVLTMKFKENLLADDLQT